MKKNVPLRDSQDKNWFDKEVGDLIKHYRESGGLSLDELADLIGYSKVFIKYCERGINSPSTYVVWLISSALKIPIEKLIPKSTTENNKSSRHS